MRFSNEIDASFENEKILFILKKLVAESFFNQRIFHQSVTWHSAVNFNDSFFLECRFVITARTIHHEIVHYTLLNFCAKCNVKWELFFNFVGFVWIKS